MHHVVGSLLTLVGLLGLWFAAGGQVSAQTSRRCFAETSFCIEGRIRQIWEQSGGLTTFGYPIGPLQQSVISGQTLQVQWFQRQRIELHPENVAPYDVLLGRLGAERLAAQGRDWWQIPQSAPQSGCVHFAETGHNVCPPFLAAWRSDGLEFDGQAGSSAAESLALFGMPVSDAQTETIDGVSLTIQWFERARFELRSAGGAVAFGLLGTELAPSGTPAPEVTPVVSGQPPQATPTLTPRPTTTSNEPPPPTSVSLPATATRVPPTRVLPTATSTLLPTSTPIRPTNTAVPPTATPGRPPNLPPAGGLPSASRGDVNIDLSLPPGGDSITAKIGDIVVVGITTDDQHPLTNDPIVFTVTGPNNGVVETVTLYGINPLGSVLWLWTPRPEYARAAYTIAAQQGATTFSGTVTVADREQATAPGAIFPQGVVTAIRNVSCISQGSISSNDGVRGAPGDRFGIVLSGFSPAEIIQLYLYGSQASADSADYVGELSTLTADGKGQATYTLDTGNLAEGSYLVITRAEAEAAADPDNPENPVTFPSSLLRSRIDLSDAARSSQPCPPANSPAPTVGLGSTIAPAAEPTATVTPEAVHTSEPTATVFPTASPTATGAPTATAAATEAVTLTPTTTFRATSTNTPTASPVETATPTKSAIPTATSPVS